MHVTIGQVKVTFSQLSCHFDSKVPFKLEFKLLTSLLSLQLQSPSVTFDPKWSNQLEVFVRLPFRLLGWPKIIMPT
jgi:hypothetical protein